jgi:hypothetical protein
MAGLQGLMLLFAGLFPHEWLHPGGSGYWFYSGVFDAGILLGVFSGIGVYWRAHNCHVKGCWRLDWHPHPAHGHPVCYLHHPDGGSEFLHSRHHQVKRPTATSPAGSSVNTEAPAAH